LDFKRLLLANQATHPGTVDSESLQTIVEGLPVGRDPKDEDFTNQNHPLGGCIFGGAKECPSRCRSKSDTCLRNYADWSDYEISNFTKMEDLEAFSGEEKCDPELSKNESISIL
jgi:hypothetical protein